MHARTQRNAGAANASMTDNTNLLPQAGDVLRIRFPFSLIPSVQVECVSAAPLSTCPARLGSCLAFFIRIVHEYIYAPIVAQLQQNRTIVASTVTALQPDWPAPFGTLALEFVAPCTVADFRNLTCVIRTVDTSQFTASTYSGVHW